MLPLSKMIDIINSSIRGETRKKKKDQVEEILNDMEDYRSSIDQSVLSKKENQVDFNIPFPKKRLDELKKEEVEKLEDDLTCLLRRTVGLKFDTLANSRENLESITAEEYDFNVTRIMDFEIEDRYNEESMRYRLQTTAKKRQADEIIDEIGMKEETISSKFKTRYEEGKESLKKSLKDIRMRSKDFDSDEKKDDGRMDIQYEDYGEEDADAMNPFKYEQTQMSKEFDNIKHVYFKKRSNRAKRSNKSSNDKRRLNNGKKLKIDEHFKPKNKKN